MNLVVHLSRKLDRQPDVPALAGVAVRNYAGSDDIGRWLDLRTRAFADETPRVRPWTRADFVAEFISKPWWSPERMWFAVADEVVGSVALAFRGPADTAVPVVHWLMVLPDWRRRGVGKLLMATLEAACWEAGFRRIAIETHSGWTAAEGFYRSLSYRSGG
ncbi:MAG TPA: GNAT family N-acetyltransferase [Pirellulales bacterium]|nr:GNAT family N-acetyltransferase [Pirellulales bacterium]